MSNEVAVGLLNKPPIELWEVDASLVPLVGGHRNKAFRTVGLDPDFVFKTTRRDQAAVEWLLPVLGLAEQSGFIVPQPTKSKNGRYIERGWTCEPFIPGETFHYDDMSGIGPQLLRFQESTRYIQQRPGFLSAHDFISCDQGGDIDLRGMPSNIVAQCRKAWSGVAAQPTCVVHGDLNPSNLIQAKHGRVAVLDWDECRVDAAFFDLAPISSNSGKMIELAVIAWEVACSWHLEPDHAIEIAAKFARMFDG